MSRSSTLVSAVAFALAWPASAQVSVVVDPPPVSEIFDDFNDGVDTATAFGNTASAGEAGGVASITIPVGASDPQFQFPTPGDPFDIVRHPYFRVGSRGSIGGASQVFPLPPAGPTVVNYTSTATFSEAQLTFSTEAPIASGAGLRFDPLPGGTAAVETFDFDYVFLDEFPTISIAEYDRDGAGGLNPNAQIANVQVSAATSSLSATTNGVDPIFQRVGLAVDAGTYNVLEIRAAFDPLSTSRFEVFWGTDVNPGPAGGQSVVLTGELIRDGEFHTYRLKMGDDVRWANTLNVLRIDPLADADAASGRAFSIDYVRLLAGAPVTDTDGDGLPDAIETETGTFVDTSDTGTDPDDPDSDGDTFDDGEEVAAGTDPNDAGSTPGAVLDSYSEAVAVYGIGAPIAPNTPVVLFGSATGFGVSPALPEGLELNVATGEISGNPTTVAPASDYTVTASFAGSPDSSVAVNIEVRNPFVEGYSSQPATYLRGEAIPPNRPLLSGAAPSLFAVAPPLPDGLSLDPNSGEITGAPALPQPATDYVVTASYAGFPDAEVTLSIEVEAVPVLVVDPAQAITNFTSLGEFNTDGDTEGWASNNANVLASGGLLVVNTTAPDPQTFETGLALDTSSGEHTVLEFRLRQPDNVFVEFFWADANGGLSAVRRFGIEGAAIPGDGDFHIYQIDMTGVFSGAVDIIRLDPGGDAGRTVEFDYIRLGNFAESEPPVFTDITYDSDLEEATITWTSTPGERFIVEASADGEVWSELDDSWEASAVGDTTSYLDVNAASFPDRIYRVSRAQK